MQVWVLAAVQGAITLSWLIYNIYLPQLLTQFGFPASLAVGLVLVENALGAVLEPVMGGLSDQARRWVGTRFPFISVGMILASALFIAIPCVVSLIPPTTVMRRHSPPQAGIALTYSISSLGIGNDNISLSSYVPVGDVF